MTGKLKTAIKIVLLFALAAIPERSVSEEANPNDVKMTVNKNKNRSAIGLLKKTIKSTNPVSDKMLHRKKL